MAGTAAAGVADSGDLVTGLIVNIDEAVYMYSPEDLPLLTGYGADGNTVIGTRPVDQIEFGWLDEENLGPRTLLAGAHTTGDTFITVAAGEQFRFSTGDCVMIRKANGDEIIRITGYSATTSGILLATRAYAGTATNYASGAEIIGLGTILDEGSDPQNFRFRDTEKRTNLTQIYGPWKISMTGTAQVIPRYGIPHQWAHQLRLRVLEDRLRLEQNLLYGARVSDTLKRMSGGLRYFLSSNTDSTTTQLTIAGIVARQQACYNEGGVPPILICNPASLTDLNDVSNTSIVRTTNVDTMRGRARVSYVETEFGTLTIVRDRWCSKLDAFGISRDLVTRRVLRPVQFSQLAKTGDADSAQFVSEEGLQVKGEKHMFRFSNLTAY